jgi:hypothetical protein
MSLTDATKVDITKLIVFLKREDMTEGFKYIRMKFNMA